MGYTSTLEFIQGVTEVFNFPEVLGGFLCKSIRKLGKRVSPQGALDKKTPNGDQASSVMVTPPWDSGVTKLWDPAFKLLARQTLPSGRR